MCLVLAVGKPCPFGVARRFSLTAWTSDSPLDVRLCNCFLHKSFKIVYHPVCSMLKFALKGAEDLIGC